jgi:hypothetical protein
MTASLWFALPPQVVQAATITVCESGCDYATIQAAIDSPFTHAGDIISVQDQVHTEAGVVVDKSVSIVGAHPSGTTVQAHAEEDAAGDRVFTIEAGADVTIQELTIRHGRVRGTVAQGGGILNDGTLTLERSTVTANRAVGLNASPKGHTGSGGGIYNSGSLTVVMSTVSHNVAQGGNGSASAADGGDAEGGGIANGEAGTLIVINSTISGNNAVYGDGFS